MRNTAPDLLEAAETALAARKMTEAWRLFADAESAGAEPTRYAAGRWLLSMLEGDFDAAWQESDRIAELERAQSQVDPNRLWHGEPIRGKRVMLRCLHGYGDAVQFLRFAPALRAQADRLIVEVAPPLVRLVQFIDGIDEVITWGDQAPATPPAWDVQIEINELSYMLRVKAQDLARTEPYLTVPSEQQRQHRPQPHEQTSLKVGLVWAAGSWNPARSIPFAAFSCLLQVQGCEFWNLQGGEARGDWKVLQGPRFHAAEDCAESLPALAALIAQLDLVITCDTLAAHLAGAQNVPCWLLLQHCADWRWMHGRNDTPWYGSMRLWRRSEEEGWPALLERVAEELRRHAAQALRAGGTPGHDGL